MRSGPRVAEARGILRLSATDMSQGGWGVCLHARSRKRWGNFHFRAPTSVNSSFDISVLVQIR